MHGLHEEHLGQVGYDINCPREEVARSYQPEHLGRAQPARIAMLYEFPVRLCPSQHPLPTGVRPAKATAAPSMPGRRPSYISHPRKPANRRRFRSRSTSAAIAGMVRCSTAVCLGDFDRRPRSAGARSSCCRGAVEATALGSPVVATRGVAAARSTLSTIVPQRAPGFSPAQRQDVGKAHLPPAAPRRRANGQSTGSVR